MLPDPCGKGTIGDRSGVIWATAPTPAKIIRIIAAIIARLICRNSHLRLTILSPLSKPE